MKKLWITMLIALGTSNVLNVQAHAYSSISNYVPLSTQDKLLMASVPAACIVISGGGLYLFKEGIQKILLSAKESSLSPVNTTKVSKSQQLKDLFQLIAGLIGIVGGLIVLYQSGQLSLARLHRDSLMVGAQKALSTLNY